MNSRTQFGHPIFFIDPEYHIKKCSTSLLSHLENPDESTIVEHKCHQLFYDHKQPCPGCPVSRAVVLKTVVERKIQRIFADQSKLVPAVATPIQEQDGHIRHIIMDCLDENHVTVREANQLDLESNAHEKKVTIDQSLVLDRNLKIIFHSSGLKNMISEKVDLFGRNVFTAVAYYNRPEIRNQLEDFVSRNERLALDFETDDSSLGGSITKDKEKK